MTSAAHPLLHVSRSGVYRAPPEIHRLHKAAMQARLAWFTVNLAGIRNKNRFLAECAARLGFPDSFGHNWDALADCLQDLSWQSASGYVIHLRNAAAFAAAAVLDWATALEILRDAANFWSSHDKVFIVLVDGAAELPVLST